MASDSIIKFLIDCFIELKKYNVDIQLTPKDEIYLESDKMWVGGAWVDSDKKNLIFYSSVAGKVTEWLPTFIHEYCHFLQWREQTPEWRAYNDVTSSNFDKIIYNKPIKQSIMDNTLKSIIDIELDCERRAVELIKSNKLSVDIRDYIRRANVYLYFYSYLKDYRRWYDEKNNPFMNKEILNVAGCRFRDDYTTIPPKLLKQFNKYYKLPSKNKIIE